MGIATFIFLASVLAILATGLLAGLRKGDDARLDYALASRDHGALLTSLSTSATDVSGWVLMGLVGMAFTYGLGTLWVIPGGLIGYALNWGLVARRLRKDSLERGSQTFPEFLAGGFDAPMMIAIRLLTGVIIVVSMTWYISAQYLACGKLLQNFLDIPYQTGVLLGLGISIPYVIIVGMRGTSWSDLIQAILIAIVILVVPLMAIQIAGGFQGVTEGLRAADTRLLSLGADSALGVPGIIFWLSLGMAYPGQPHVNSRFMAAKDDKALTQGRWIAIGWFVLVAGMAVLAGVTARAAFTDELGVTVDPNTGAAVYTETTAESDTGPLNNDGEAAEFDKEVVLVEMAQVILPPFLIGLVLAAVTAAIMSTADSMALVVITTLLWDFFGKSKALGKRADFVVRLIVGLSVACIAAGLALTVEKGVFKAVLDAWGMMGAAFAAAVLYRLWVNRPSGLAILAGIITGGITFYNIPGDYWQYQIVAGVSASALVIAFVHFLVLQLQTQPSVSKPEEEE
jgi:sodium/proline symporter